MFWFRCLAVLELPGAVFFVGMERDARGRWHRSGQGLRRGILLGLRETALLRQGLLSEPQASSGPTAMLLAASRSPSSIPRRSPCLERCHLPLASLNHIHLSKSQKHPRLHPLPERCLLPLASLYTSASQNPNNIHPGPMPPSSSVPLYIRLTSPQALPGPAP